MNHPENLPNHVQGMSLDARLGCAKIPSKRRLALEYLQLNIVEPFHGDHLRGLLLGHSLARIRQFNGDDVFNTLYLQDWGLLVAITMSQFQAERPRLPYFDHNFTGQYPTDDICSYRDIRNLFQSALDTRQPLELWKSTQSLMEAFQNARWGVRTLWQQWIQITISHYQAVFGQLGIHLDLWLGESDVQSYVSQVNTSVIIPEAGKNRLAALIQYVLDLRMEHIVYLVAPSEQDTMTHFSMVAPEVVSPTSVEFDYVWFGHMWGRDRTSFATDEVNNFSLDQVLTQLTSILTQHSPSFNGSGVEKPEFALAALKFSVLSHQRRNDFFFEINQRVVEKYLTLIAALKHIAQTLDQGHTLGWEQSVILTPIKNTERRLMLTISNFPVVVTNAYDDFSPHYLAKYGIDLSEAYEHFSHECRILREENRARRASWLQITTLTGKILRHVLFLLGIDLPPSL